MAGKQKNQDIEKTNVMRLLDSLDVDYIPHCYIDSGAVSGVDVAAVLGIDRERVFKTLVTAGKSGEHYVFMIPVAEELDLKKAASAACEKFVEMIKSRDLLAVTGYIHGGCSPIGMKKQFPVFVDETAVLYDEIVFSAGKIGYQVEIKTDDLSKAVKFEYADLCC